MNTGKVIFLTIVVSAITSAGTFFGLQHFTSGSLGGVVIPQLGGLTPDQGRRMLESKGLLLIVTERREDPKIEKGRIISQVPLEGSKVKKGAEVRVVISTGISQTQVPVLERLAKGMATQTLTTSGLSVGTVTQQHHDTIPKDHVISSSPGAGQKAVKGSPVNLVISDGPGGVEVPNVVYRGLRQAQRLIAEAGFKVGRISYFLNEDHREGIVLRQKPKNGEKAPKGSAIDLVINQEQ